MEKYKVDSKELGARLYWMHTTPDVIRDPTEVVFRQRDVIDLLGQMGLPEPDFNLNREEVLMYKSKEV